jgi:hypothetical protein
MGAGVSTWVLAPQAGRPPTSKASNARGQDPDEGGAGGADTTRDSFAKSQAKATADKSAFAGTVQQ